MGATKTDKNMTSCFKNNAVRFKRKLHPADYRRATTVKIWSPKLGRFVELPTEVARDVKIQT